MAEQLSGRYRVYDGAYPSYIDLMADGTFFRASSKRELVEKPVDFGTWSISDSVLELFSDESSDYLW